MTDINQKIAKLEKGLRQVQAENWALKYLITAMYAQGTDINEVMKHFLKITEEIETHNTYSTLPEDFVSSFAEAVRLLAGEMQVALQRAPEMRHSEKSTRHG